ncbi:MAG: hypothetical protein R2758_14415 [Bacteroidales bacterium]
MFTLSGLCLAQDRQPTAVATERGMWIYLGNEIPEEFEYQVLKSEGMVISFRWERWFTVKIRKS